MPALATWQVHKGERTIASIDGGRLDGLVDLLPDRAPVLLNPGEYLSYKRALLAGDLPWTRGSTYQVQVAFTAHWLDKAPADGDKPLTLPLTANGAIAVR